LKPFLTLAEARTPQGAAMTLHTRDGNFFLRVNRQPLMGTNASWSELRLAELACQGLGRGRKSRVLIGGLGFGFSLRRVLEMVSQDSVAHVAELLPEMVQWNREFLGEVNGKLLDDPRVQISIKDVFHVIAGAPKAHYDAILLDVDNCPVALVKDGNARLYEERGLAEIMRVLKPRGRVAFWSASQDAAFAKRLVKAGLKVEAIGAKAYEQARRNSHTIFVADRPGHEPAPGKARSGRKS
jgi:spermidine synthase